MNNINMNDFMNEPVNTNDDLTVLKNTFEKYNWNIFLCAEELNLTPMEVYFRAKNAGMYEFMNDKDFIDTVLKSHAVHKVGIKVAKELGISVYRVDTVLLRSNKKRFVLSDYERKLLEDYYKKLPIKDMSNLLMGRSEYSICHLGSRKDINYKSLTITKEVKNLILNSKYNIQSIKKLLKCSTDEAVIYMLRVPKE